MSTSQLRITSDFTLGNFLKNEKTVRADDVPVARSFCKRVNMVDTYVTHEYWALDMEYLISSIVPILWSITGIYLITQLLPSSCIQANNTIHVISSVLFIMNVSDVLTLFAMLYAKSSEFWKLKIVILHVVIGIKLFLTALNFLLSIYCFFLTSCGYYRNLNHGNAPEKVALEKYFGEVVVNGFRYYDVKILGLNHVFASVGQCVGAMMLCVKRNDLKMYVLWRMGQLDNYIQDLHSHQ